MGNKKTMNKDVKLMIIVFAVCAAVLFMAIVGAVAAIVGVTSSSIASVPMFEDVNDFEAIYIDGMNKVGGQDYSGGLLDMTQKFWQTEKYALDGLYYPECYGLRISKNALISGTGETAYVRAYVFGHIDDANEYYYHITNADDDIYYTELDLFSVSIFNWEVYSEDGQTEYHRIVRKENKVYHLYANDEALFEELKDAVEAVCEE